MAAGSRKRSRCSEQGLSGPTIYGSEDRAAQSRQTAPQTSQSNASRATTQVTSEVFTQVICTASSGDASREDHQPEWCVVEGLYGSTSTSSVSTLLSPSPPSDTCQHLSSSCTCLSCPACEAEVLNASYMLSHNEAGSGSCSPELPVDACSNTLHNVAGAELVCNAMTEQCPERRHPAAEFLMHEMLHTALCDDTEPQHSDSDHGEATWIGEAWMGHAGTECGANHTHCAHFSLPLYLPSSEGQSSAQDLEPWNQEHCQTVPRSRSTGR